MSLVRAIPICVALCTLAGCSHQMIAEETSGPIGCAPEAIRISDVNTPLEGPQWWWATCTEGGDEQRYFCSRLKTDLICSTAPPESAMPTDP